MGSFRFGAGWLDSWVLLVVLIETVCLLINFLVA